jgi:CheY-like chemotaxis protein
MSVSSQVGQGTTVRLWLPKTESVPDDLPSQVREASGPGHLYSSVGGLRILLVDDDELVRRGTAEMLEDLGHTVFAAGTGFQALERLGTCGSKVDLVITDHAMPGMSGAELIKGLRISHPLLPVLLASGYADMAEEHTGDWPRLSKPFRQVELAAAIVRAVGRSGKPTVDKAAAYG